ncbi:DUF3048 domain-containing protein [Streptomyces sp. B93]|uniref:DUF3048 domain-containing protein n=1 Tax=Streptomyces sp. B93 TaxID=2824875 RepID=UPI001B37B202|nr:DUF3048 domain-containing protein [Streptomyces sp. B93]MBQ1092723.1 DUF3048 domain-containing protein [Streptomyces sp. B93]
MTQAGRVAAVGTSRGTRGRGRAGRATWTAAVLAVALTASLTAGCSSGGERDDGRSPSGTASGERTPPAAGGVLAVKIDNARKARPHTGLDAADIVYVEQVEGGLSRLLAVYATRLPETVGPVRSARESDLELLRQFHRPTLAFSGVQSKLLPLIDEAPLRAEPPGRTREAYFRENDRPAPHNLYLRPDRLLPAAPGARALTTTGFRHGPAPAGGSPETSRTVRFPAASFTFTWSAHRDGWLVAMDGTDARTTDGQRVAPATVVVQHVHIRTSDFHDSNGNVTPYIETVGSGRAEVLRDGKSYDAHWKRDVATDGTRFTTGDGTPLNFADGQVWVVFVKA